MAWSRGGKYVTYIVHHESQLSCVLMGVGHTSQTKANAAQRNTQHIFLYMYMLDVQNPNLRKAQCQLLYLRSSLDRSKLYLI